MPSNNNKNKKTNSNNLSKKVSSPSEKASSRVPAQDMRPHFFDKKRIDFSFPEKKIDKMTQFVNENECSGKGFVDAHFYPTSHRKSVVDETQKAEDVAEDVKIVFEGEKAESTHISDLLGTVGMAKIVGEVKPNEPSDKIFVKLPPESDEKKHVSDAVDSIGMKRLLEEESAEKETEKKVKDIEFFAFPDENVTHDEPAIVSRSKSRPVVFVPADTDARRENEAILAELSPSDIKKSVENEKKGSPLSFLRYAAMALCLVVLVVSSYRLVSGFAERQREKDKNDELRDAFNSGEIGYTTIGYARQDMNFVPDDRLYSDEGEIYKAPEPEVYDMHEKYVRMLPNLQALKYVNSSAFAWIKVGGTRVDYPVVRSPQGDNDYYLSHGLDRTYSVSGAVFTDYNNSTRLSNNRNTCVYGHNMNDGTMFQTIMNFKEKNQFLNSTIELYTVEGIYVYTPFAVYDAIPTESFFKTEFASDEEFVAFLDDIRSKSIFTNKDVKTDKNSKVVTLITCTNTVTDKRFVVHGVLDEIAK
ncbi:MAG: class B sortase [Ruminococcaceae bacterium]|nr:class B sortase [Oscillospiraceae bacterium]